MAHVVVIQPGHGTTLEPCPFVLAVPVDHHVEAIWVRRRRHEDDNILEQRPVLRVGHQLMSEHHGELAGADFRGVDVVVDEHHGRHMTRERVFDLGRE